MDMSVWDFNYFDIIIGSIVVILGFKGFMNGFAKELFGLIGLIGGVYIASRTAESIGNIIDKELFQMNNPATLKLFGFIAVLAGVWILSVIVGSIFTRLTRMSGLGFFDSLFGFIFGAWKYFLVFALIVTALSNVTLVRDNLQEHISNSLLYPYLKNAGSFLINLDTTQVAIEEMNTTITTSPVAENLASSLVDENLTTQ